MATLWGDITGLLSDQQDLQNTLDSKANNITVNEKSNGLDKVSEEIGKIGWILKDNNGRLVSNPVGNHSVDFTWQDQANFGRVVGALGDYSFAIGRNTLSSGFNSTALGDGSIASGNNSVASGLNTLASGDYSFVAGRDNIADGLQSFVVGVNNTAESNSSFVSGNTNMVVPHPTNTFQTAINGFASGTNLIVHNPNQSVFGTYNVLDEADNSNRYKIFSIGIGSASPGTRQNGFEVYNGTGIERGSVKAPYLQQATIQADITGKVLITKEYLESAYNHAFDDAPIDGKIYGRKNKAWEEVADHVSTTQVYYKGIVSPPVDLIIPNQPGRTFTVGDVYLHYNLPTHQLIDGNLLDADGNTALWDGNYGDALNYKQYILQNEAILPTDPPIYVWEEMSFGIHDAPSGFQYNRSNGTWTKAAIQVDAPIDGKQYVRQDSSWIENGGGGGSGLEAIDEGNGIGWRLVGKDEAYFDNIGLDSIDMSVQDGLFDPRSATGEVSFVSGINTLASGDYSFATGNMSEARATHSHAEGHGNICKGNDGHVENHFNYIDTDMHACHAEGFGNAITESNDYVANECGGNRIIPPGGGATIYEGTHVEGMYTWAYGFGTHAEGIGTKARNEGQHVAGTYNKGTSGNTIHETGIGSDNSNRRNAFEIYYDGRIIAPELTDMLDPKSLVTREWVDNNTGGSVPLDKQLENADIINIEYDGNNKLTRIIYGAIDDLSQGYYGEYNYDGIGTLTSIDLYSNLGIYTLILEYAYDGNGNLISLTRTIPSPP